MKLTQAGFTLIELILAMTITAVLSVTMFMSLSVALETKARAEDRLSGRQAARAALDLLAADLTAVPDPGGRIAGPFEGEDQRMGAAREADRLSFVTASLTLPTDGDLGDLRGVELALVDDPDDPDTRLLVRYVTANLLASVTPEPTPQVLARGVVSFNARYFDGGDWLDDWDSAEQDNELPNAVELTLTLRPERRRADEDTVDETYDLTLVRLIRLPAAPEPESAAGGAGGGGGLFSF